MTVFELDDTIVVRMVWIFTLGGLLHLFVSYRYIVINNICHAASSHETCIFVHCIIGYIHIEQCRLVYINIYILRDFEKESIQTRGNFH